MKLHRMVIDWQGPAIVGRAVTVLHWDGTEQASPPVADVRAAFEAAKNTLNPGGTLTFPASGDSIDSTTGHLNGTWISAGGGTVTSTAPGGAAAGVGACIGWTTGGIVAGASGVPRRLRGRTFLVPIGGDAYDGTGHLKPAHVAVFDALGASIRAAGPLGIWHHPTTKGGSDGNTYAVLSHKVRPTVAVLRSRRD